MYKTLVPTQAERGLLGEIMDALWPILGGSHTAASVWTQISDDLTTVLARHALRTTPNLATAVEDEREACAKLAEDHIPERTGSVADASARATARSIAAAIRFRTRPPTLPDDRDAAIASLREALTPSGDTKAAYHGEFSFTIKQAQEDEDGEAIEVDQRVYVPWTTVKEIMAAIRARAALSKHDRNEGGDDGQG